jgi:hypothetical protein
MTERRPIYSARTAGQQIGYIEGDEAFDLFDRPCGKYDSDTGLLRDKNHAVVGYISLADIFIGSSWMALELFFKTDPIAPAKQEDGRSDVPTSGAESGNAANLDTMELIAQARNAARTNLSLTSTGAHLEKAGMEDQAPQATDFATFESSSLSDEIVGAVLSSAQFDDSSSEHCARPQDVSDLENADMEEHAPQATDFFESSSLPDQIVSAVLPSAQFEDSSPEHCARPQDVSDLENADMEEHAPPATDYATFESSSLPDEIVGAVLPSAQFEDSSPEHCARPQDASDADKGLASGEPGSDYPGRTKAEAGDGPQVDASLKMPEPSNESIVAGAQPDSPSARDGMPPAVELFMQHLSEYLRSTAHPTAPLSSDDAAEVKLSPKAESQVDMDRLQFLSEDVPVEDESSDSTQQSGGSLERAHDNHQQDNLGASEGVETHNAQRDMDRILVAVLKVVEKNSSND